MLADPFAATGREVDHLVVLPEVDSTNLWLGQSGLSGVVAVVSWNQTAGRGRAGRTWQSPPGQSLALSLRLPAVPTSSHGLLPLAAGAVLVSHLRQAGVQEAGLKWPNDVLIRGAKVAGLLTEKLPSEDIVVGLGLNVLGSPDSLPLGQARSLADEGFEVDYLGDLLAAWCRDLRHVHSLLCDGEDASVLERVSCVMTTLGNDVRVEGVDGTSRVGRAVSLDSGGGLVVSWADGDGHSLILAGDVWHLRTVDRSEAD